MKQISGFALCFLLLFARITLADDGTLVLAQNPNTPAPIQMQRPNAPAQTPKQDPAAPAQVTPPQPDTRAQTPIQRPVSPRIDQVKEQDAALKACLADNRKLKDQLAGLERDLKDVRAKLAAATKEACIADDIYRDAAGKVRHCGAYRCNVGHGGCPNFCNTSDWCNVPAGYVCATSPAPGRCVSSR
jgi:hypothetical protein